MEKDWDDKIIAHPCRFRYSHIPGENSCWQRRGDGEPGRGGGWGGRGRKAVNQFRFSGVQKRENSRGRAQGAERGCEKVKLISPQFLEIFSLPVHFLFALEAVPASLKLNVSLSPLQLKFPDQQPELVVSWNSTLKLLKQRACMSRVRHQHLRGRAEAHGGSLCSEKRSPGVHVQTAILPGPTRPRPTEPGPWRRARITSGTAAESPAATHSFRVDRPSPTGTCACTVRTQAVILHFSLVFDKDSITTSARPGALAAEEAGCAGLAAPPARGCACAEWPDCPGDAPADQALGGLLQHIKGCSLVTPLRELQEHLRGSPSLQHEV